MSLVCINAGYANTKVKTSTNEFMLPSKTRLAIDEYEKNTILDKGELFVIGDGNYDIELDKTISKTHMLCVRYALKKANVKNAKVVSALPINAYRNKIAREDYREMLLALPDVADVKIFMEGMAAVLADFSWYKGKLVCLLDVGGLTINFMLADNGNLIRESAFSAQLGTIILENRIKNAIEQSELSTIAGDYQIKYLLNKPQIKNVTESYIDEIKQLLKRNKYPTEVCYRFTGGGALSYSDLFYKSFSNLYISKDALFENVRGLYNFGGVMF